jgi:hypothetical protein
MESRLRHGKQLGKAALLIRDRSRFYVQKGKYGQIQVFSTNLREVQLLRRTYTGNYYTHGVGWIWILSDARKLRGLYNLLLPYLPPEHPFHKISQCSSG